jgi:hypothetical protein
VPKPNFLLLILKSSLIYTNNFIKSIDIQSVFAGNIQERFCSVLYLLSGLAVSIQLPGSSGAGKLACDATIFQLIAEEEASSLVRLGNHIETSCSVHLGQSVLAWPLAQDL